MRRRLAAVMRLWRTDASVLLVFFSCAVPCLAADAARHELPAPPPHEPSSRIEALIPQLSSDDWKARERAQKELVEIGDDAVPTLERLLKEKATPELHAQVETLLKQIEHAKAFGASRVTLHVKDAPFRDAGKALAKQAGARFEVEGLAWANVTLDVDRQPFWVAAHALCAQAGVRPTEPERVFDAPRPPPTLSVESDGGIWARRPWYIAGPVLVTVKRVHVLRSRNFGEAEPVRSRIQVEVQPHFEPKLEVLSWSLSAVDEAVDENGRSLLGKPMPADEDEDEDEDGESGSGSNDNLTPISLALPPNVGKKIARLKATGLLNVRADHEAVEVGDVLRAKDVRRPFGRAVLHFQELVIVGPDHYELRYEVFRGTANAKQWEALRGVPRDGMQVLDSAGNRLLPKESRWTGTGDKVTIRARFFRMALGDRPKPGQPAKVVWDVPTAVRQIEVPIELKDLPLP